MIKNIAAGAKFIFAFFIHLQIVKIRETRKVRKKKEDVFLVK